MYSTGVDASGVDRGFENTKQVWAEELAGFADKLDAMKYALKVTDPSRPPTVREFLALCRNAPEPHKPALPFKPTAQDEERNRAAIAKAANALKPKVVDGIDRHWGTHPRSQLQLRAIFAAAEKDVRFAPCITEMIEQGVCTAAGKLLKPYRDGVFSSY